MLRSLGHRDFRRLWIGFGIAALGFQVQRVGLGFLAYDLTGSALYLALVFSGDSIPMILLSPLGGVLGDRVDRKALLMASRCVVAALALAIAVLTWTDAIATWHLLLFALLTGVCYALDVPARQAMMHDLVPPSDFVNAIALTSTLRQASRIVGPAIGGLALLAIGTQGTFAFMAGAQVAAVALVALVHLPHRPPGRVESAAANLKEGIRFIREHEQIRLLLLISAVPALTAMAYQSLTPVFAEDVLGRGSAAIGVMLSAAGVGALLGSFSVAWLAERAAQPGVSALATVLFGLSVAVFAVSQSYPLSLGLLVAAGLTGALSSIACSSAIQQRTPNDLQGRVMGVYQTTWELQVLGSLAVGALADVTSAPVALSAAGLLSAGAVAALYAVRSRRVAPTPNPSPTV